MTDDLNNYDLGSDFDFDEYYQQPDDLTGAPASSSSDLSVVPSSDDDDNDATQKICTRPRCPHNKVPLPLVNFQETNKRGEVITWKHCKDCRTKHAKEDRQRKQAIRAKARARTGDDKKDEDNDDEDDDERGRKRLVLTLRAPPEALRILNAGGRIEGEIAETFVDAPILVLKGGGRRARGEDRRRSSAYGKRPKDEDSSDGEWGLQAQKRRKSVQKGGLGKAKKKSVGGRGRISKEGEFGPEGSVYDSGTNSEEEADKKRGERGARAKK